MKEYSGGKKSRGQSTCEKLDGKQFHRFVFELSCGELFRGICLRDKSIRVVALKKLGMRQLSKGKLFQRKCPGKMFERNYLGVIVQGKNTGGSFPGRNLTGGYFSGGSVPGREFLNTQLLSPFKFEICFVPLAGFRQENFSSF